MSPNHTKMAGIYLLVGLTAICVNALAIAQEAETNTSEEDEVIEEIIVYGGDRPDDPVDVDALYEEMMRERMMTDFKTMRTLEEQQEWRDAEETTTATTGRIKWGYSPQDDVRFDRASDMPDADYITTKPATVFSFEF